jgi:rubrerythrin
MMKAIKMAIKTETDAIAFYKEAAEKTRHPFGKKMFLSIMEDEIRHHEAFKCLLQGLDVKVHDFISPMKKIKTVFEESREHLLERIEATTDEIEALKIAMQMEKESIDLYKKIAKEVQTLKERSLFEKLAAEEQQHYDILSNTYFFLLDSGSWYMWEEYSIVDGGTPWA